MTYGDIMEQLKTQRVYVEFIDMAQVSLDEKPDDGMRGQLLSIQNSQYNDEETPPELHVWFDLSGFEAHNKTVAKRDWYDENDCPTLTWLESKYYPKDGKIDFYISGSMDSRATVFNLIDFGCECCIGDEPVLDDSGVSVFVDENGKLSVFVGEAEEPAATGHVAWCPQCGRVFPVPKRQDA